MLEALVDNVIKQEDRNMRIRSCSTHWFFGNTNLQPQLLQRGGVEGKIARQKAKLAKHAEAEMELQAVERELDGRVLALQGNGALRAYLYRKDREEERDREERERDRQERVKEEREWRAL